MNSKNRLSDDEDHKGGGFDGNDLMLALIFGLAGVYVGAIGMFLWMTNG